MWPHDLVLLWLQDIGVVAAEVVAFTWLCELAGRRHWGRDAMWPACAGLVLLVANPWIWWAISFDFHTETLTLPFVVLLARDLADGRRRAWVWLAPLLAGGDVAATYIAGVGLGAVLAGRRSRWQGSVMACVGVAAALLIALIHGNMGSGGGLHAYAYLAAAAPTGAQVSLGALAKGITLHPLEVLRVLWAKRLDVWANLAPTGLLGVGFGWLLPISVIVLLANNLYMSWLFAAPSFQGLPLYVLLPAGTVAVLSWLARRYRRTALVLAGLVLAQALAWTAIWLPRIPGQWLRVSAPAASTLAGVETRIPAGAEVIASQGVIGGFSGRADMYALIRSSTLAVHGETWFVIAPAAGIESLSTASQMALIGELAGPLHATLVAHANGVWAFRWSPPPGVHSVVVPDGAELPGWATPGSAGSDVLTGPVRSWHVSSTGAQGYVCDGLTWLEPTGRYQASVTLSATGPVNVEVWDDNGDVLLARRSIPATAGVKSITLPVNATTGYPASVYSGWGPFRANFVPPPSGQRLEVRVWSPGSEKVNVYRAELVRTNNAPGVKAGS